MKLNSSVLLMGVIAFICEVTSILFLGSTDFLNLSNTYSVAPEAPESPCPLVYAVPHHQWAPTRVYHLMYTWFMAEENTTETSPLTLQEQVPSHVVVLQVLAFLCLEGTVVLVLFVSVCSGWLRERRKASFEYRMYQRMQKEKKEREAAEKIISEILEDQKSMDVHNDSGEDSGSQDTSDATGGDPPLVDTEPAKEPSETADGSVQKRGDWGSRLQKYWFLQDNTLWTVAKNPCIALDSPTHQEGLKNLLEEVSHLPNIQPIHSMKYKCDEGGRQQVTMTQPFHKDGSLRDLIHGGDPTRDWSEKYLHSGAPLPPEKVASYGRQVLKAMLELYGRRYNDIALNPLEHVQVGNIFVVDDTCLLGGYENKLLGYRPRLFRTIQRHEQLPHIDVIMFGHVVYEMASGKELSRLIPNEEDYSHVQDVSCRKILQYIFTQNKDGKIKHSIQEIMKNGIFSSKSKAIQAVKKKLQVNLKRSRTTVV